MLPRRRKQPLSTPEEMIVLGAALTMGAMAFVVQVLKGAEAWTRWQVSKRVL